jgi:uncharacterized protein
VTTAGSLAEVQRLASAFERLPTVHEVESVLQLIPAQQEEKLAIMRHLAAATPPRVAPAGPVDLRRLERALVTLDRRLAIVAAEVSVEGAPDLAASRQLVGSARRRLRTMAPDTARAALDALQADLARDVATTLRELGEGLDPGPIGLDDIPEGLRRRYVSPDGRFLIQVHPRVDAWEREEAAAFLDELRSVDPGVTGPAIISHEATALMERAYVQGTLYAYVLVGALSFLMIRRVRETALALLPLLLGMVWTLGLMHLFGLSFTLANIFALPFLVGACAEFGLGIVLSHLEERERGGPPVAPSAGVSVMVNGITTMVAFGSLMVAQHRGIFGLGLLLTLGTVARLLATVVVLPAIVGRWPARRRGPRVPARG